MRMTARNALVCHRISDGAGLDNARQADQKRPDARRPQGEVSAGPLREPSGEMIEIFDPLKRRLSRRTTSPPIATQMAVFHRPLLLRGTTPDHGYYPAHQNE